MYHRCTYIYLVVNWICTVIDMPSIEKIPTYDYNRQKGTDRIGDH